MPTTRSHAGRRTAMLAVVLLAVLPAAALAANNWGFGPSGQSSATITWQPDNVQKVNAVRFTLPVKARSAKTRLGRKCTIPSRHPYQVRCAISPVTSYGYVDVRTRVHMPCKRPVQFSVRFVGTTRFVRQRDIPSGNACS